MISKRLQWSLVAYTVGVSVITTLLHLAVERIARNGFAGYSLLVFAIFNTSLVFFAMWFSNRLVGPIYRLKKVLEEGRDGQKVRKIYFRKWDYFQDLNESFNAFVEILPDHLKVTSTTEPETKNPKDGASPVSKNILGNQKGLTLIEVMMAVAIVAILTTISMGSTGTTEAEFRYRKDFSSFYDALVSARNAAFVRGQCAVAHVVPPSTITIRTYPIASPCALPWPAPDLQLNYSFENASISAFSDQNGNTSPYLIFSPTGSAVADSPTDVRVTQTGGTGHTRTVRIYPAIGQIRVQ